MRASLDCRSRLETIFSKASSSCLHHPAIAFDGAIVRSLEGTDVLYVDLDKDRRFEENERFTFQPIDSSLPVESQLFKSRITMEVPLASGPYRNCPMEISLLNDAVRVTGGTDAPITNGSVGLGKILVAYTNMLFVEGTAQLPDRSLPMRFEYSFKQNAVDLNSAWEWADISGDGSRKTVESNDPELRKANGKPPLFRAGNSVVSAQSIDLATNTFVLRSMPPADYHIIDLAVGMTVPDFTFTGFDGKTHRLSEIEAKYLLLDFWFAGCPPCVADLPSKIKAYEKFHSRGFEILGMDDFEGEIHQGGAEAPEQDEDCMAASAV